MKYKQGIIRKKDTTQEVSNKRKEKKEDWT